MFEDNSKRNRIIAIIVVVVLLIAALLLVYKPWVKEVVQETPVAETQEPTVVIPASTEPEVVAQQDTPSRLKMRVKKILDKTSSMQYVVDVGVGSAMKESIVTASMETVIYDSYTRTVVSPEFIQIGTEMTFYGSGNYQVGNLLANALVVGESNNIKFGKLKEIYKDGKGYIGVLADSTDRIKISNGTKIENGLVKSVVTDLGMIKPMSSIFFYVSPNFEQTDEGLLYDSSLIVVVGNGK